MNITFEQVPFAPNAPARGIPVSLNDLKTHQLWALLQKTTRNEETIKAELIRRGVIL